MFKLFSRLLLLGLFWPLSLFAAALSFSPEQVTVSPNQPFEIGVWLDPQGESVNALGGQLNFSTDELSFKEIRLSDSIIGFWPEAPQLVAPGQVNFAGMMPGGFTGVLSPFYTGVRPGKLFSLVFIPVASGNSELSWSNVSAYLNQNDGRETAITAPILTIRSTPGATNSAPIAAAAADDNPPELFTPIISRDPNLYDGRWFVAFVTRDNGSGIAGYEVKENDNTWREAVSPYLLSDQTRASYVSIRARDQAGNERIVTLPPERQPSYPINDFWLILLLCLVAFFYYFYYWRRR